MKSRHARWLPALLLACLLQPAAADVRDDYTQGLEAYRDGDFPRAVNYFSKAADNGYVKAQVELAEMYMKGDGVAQDSEEAAKLYAKAARQGNSTAQLSLAGLYERGDGVRQDDEKAARWLYRAAARMQAGETERAQQIVREALTEEQRWQLVDYMVSLSPERQAPYSEMLLARPLAGAGIVDLPCQALAVLHQTVALAIALV